MGEYEINWQVIAAIGALIVAAWLASGLKDWAERKIKEQDDGDDED